MKLYSSRQDRAQVLKNPFDGSQACNGLDVNIFFPDPKDRMGIAQAKKVCNECVLRSTCLEFALPQPGLDGIWGGTTPRQRETLRTKYRKAAVPA